MRDDRSRWGSGHNHREELDRWKQIDKEGSVALYYQRLARWSYLKVRVSDVKKWAGREERISLSEPWPEIIKERLEAEMEQPARVHVVVRNVTSGLLVEVSGEGYVHVPCSRCLEDARLTLAFSDSQEFREESGPQDPTLDYERFIGDHIILDAMVADAVALELPLVPLCRAECRGLCPQCGVNRNRDECSCQVLTESRWDLLKTWKASPGTRDNHKVESEQR